MKSLGGTAIFWVSFIFAFSLISGEFEVFSQGILIRFDYSSKKIFVRPIVKMNVFNLKNGSHAPNGEYVAKVSGSNNRFFIESEDGYDAWSQYLSLEDLQKKAATQREFKNKNQRFNNVPALVKALKKQNGLIFTNEDKKYLILLSHFQPKTPSIKDYDSDYPEKACCFLSFCSRKNKYIELAQMNCDVSKPQISFAEFKSIVECFQVKEVAIVYLIKYAELLEIDVIIEYLTDLKTALSPDAFYAIAQAFLMQGINIPKDIFLKITEKISKNDREILDKKVNMD